MLLLTSSSTTTSSTFAWPWHGPCRPVEGPSGLEGRADSGDLLTCTLPRQTEIVLTDWVRRAALAELAPLLPALLPRAPPQRTSSGLCEDAGHRLPARAPVPHDCLAARRRRRATFGEGLNLTDPGHRERSRTRDE